MVNNHYRWDFIGLSTDEKPTPTTSEKVVDGSTFYCSDNSKLYVWCKDNWYEKTVSGGGGGTPDFNDITNRPKYNGTDMTSATDIPEVKTYSPFTGTDGTTAGTSGLVPAPATTDSGKFLKADGTWDTAGGGSVTPVQTTGTSTTDVMSQNAVTSMVFADPASKTRVQIGSATLSNVANTITIGNSNIAENTNAGLIVGYSSYASGNRAVALGREAQARAKNSVAFSGSNATVQGQFDISLSNDQGSGYNDSNYRLLTGLYDGQNAHDGVTVGQINATIDAINTALSTNIPHIGANS